MRGSVRPRGTNTWQIRVSTGRDPLTGRYGLVERTVTGTKRTAQRAVAELIAQLEEARAQNAKGTVGDLLDRWIEHIEVQGRAPATLVRYRSAIRANVAPALGHVRLSKLTPADLDRFYAALLKKGLSPLSVRKCHAIMSASLRQAVRWGMIDRSPADRTTPPSSRGREIVPPTVDEVRQLLELCAERNPDLGALIHLAATTGCRRGELCGLRWGDVDLDKATLVVARSISDVPGDVSVKDPKTHQARRLALDPDSVATLRAQHNRCQTRAAAAGRVLGPSAHVWSQELDGSVPFRPDRVTGQFIAVRRRADLGHITFHGLRHFSATELAGRGVGVRTIAGRLGHANPSVTLRTYAHFLDVADREAAEVMAGLDLGRRGLRS